MFFYWEYEVAKSKFQRARDFFAKGDTFLFACIITYCQLKVVLGGHPKCTDNHDLSICHLLYDLGRHKEQPSYQFNSLNFDSKNNLWETPPVILDFQQPVSLRLARDIVCHIIPSGLAYFLLSRPGWSFSNQKSGYFGPSSIVYFFALSSFVFKLGLSGVALKSATPDSGYSTFLVVKPRRTTLKVLSWWLFFPSLSSR